MTALTRDRLSIRAFREGWRTGDARLCCRCRKRWTVSRSCLCVGCLGVKEREVRDKLAAIEARRLASLVPMPLFGDSL